MKTRSIDEVQNLGNERRYIYKDHRQDSGQRNISYTRYPKKCFTQTYRGLYGDAMLVLTWMSSNTADGRLRVVPHFSSGIVERAKPERAWKLPHTRKSDTRRGERKMRDYRQSQRGEFHISHDASLHTILSSCRTHVMLSVQQGRDNWTAVQSDLFCR